MAAINDTTGNKPMSFDEILDNELKDMEDRTFIGAFFHAGTSSVKFVATSTIMGVTLATAGGKKFLKEHLPQAASDMSKAMDNGIVAFHRAVIQLDEMNGYDRSKSLKDNIELIDKEHEKKQALKLAKKNLQRIKEGKEPIEKKDLAWYDREIARINQEIADELAKKNPQNPSKPEEPQKPEGQQQ